METGAGSDADRYRDVAQRLHAIAKPMRVLSALRWPASVRDEFLAGGGDTLPSVEYPSFDEQPMVEAVRDVRRSTYPGELIDDWLESTAGAIELTARLLAARGTEAFLDYGRASYGTPQEARETWWAAGTNPLPLKPRMAGSAATTGDILMRFVDVFEEFARDSTECEDWAPGSWLPARRDSVALTRRCPPVGRMGVAKLPAAGSTGPVVGNEYPLPVAPMFAPGVDAGQVGCRIPSARTGFPVRRRRQSHRRTPGGACSA
jgi:Microtubule-associated tyrosine carboxypeptidase